MHPTSLSELQRWVGRTEVQRDLIGEATQRALFATLDRPDAPAQPGEEVPPHSCWVYFHAPAPTHSLGPDGHAARGEFLPPVPLPRRMWAGGELRLQRALRVGDSAMRRSTIEEVTAKQGRSGPLVFVGVRHDILVGEELVLSERQDLVYREAATAAPPGAVPATAVAAPTDQSFSRDIVPDPVLLFRYSALTFNSHRIHYDRSYVTGVEGYAGLVVHGPLIATLLLELLHAQQPLARLRSFRFRSLAPLFDIHPFRVCGREDGPGRYALWACDHRGALAMQASAEVDPGA